MELIIGNYKTLTLFVRLSSRLQPAQSSGESRIVSRNIMLTIVHREAIVAFMKILWMEIGPVALL